MNKIIKEILTKKAARKTSVLAALVAVVMGVNSPWLG